jgi:hypothetical protein
VFSDISQANERDHLQTLVQNHYWIFGEQYHLVTAAEPKFEEALRRFQYHLRGETSDVKMTHPDKNREMDIFMVRQLFESDSIRCVVVELKHPSVKLGEKELRQVKKYMSVILDQAEFNASSMYWDFYLVGNTFDTSDYIEGEFQNAVAHGEKSLAYKRDRYRIYVKMWSEIFIEFELRHKFLNDKLQMERDKVAATSTSADEILLSIAANSAVMRPAVAYPK